MCFGTKKASAPKKFPLRRKLLSGFRGTTQIAPALRPDATRRVEQPLRPNAAHTGRPTCRTSGSRAIEPGKFRLRLSLTAGSLRASVPVPLFHCFETIIKTKSRFVNYGFWVHVVLSPADPSAAVRQQTQRQQELPSPGRRYKGAATCLSNPQAADRRLQ